MLHYAVVFFVIALIAALFGFGGIAASAVGIAKILFIVFADPGRGQFPVRADPQRLSSAERRRRLAVASYTRGRRTPMSAGRCSP